MSLLSSSFLSASAQATEGPRGCPVVSVRLVWQVRGKVKWRVHCGERVWYLGRLRVFLAEKFQRNEEVLDDERMKVVPRLLGLRTMVSKI